MKKPKFLVGIDEVGRGPIAGPVAVGAFVFLTPFACLHFNGVRESKQLTEEKREEWYQKIIEVKKRGFIDFAVSFQSQKVIDARGLSYAIKKCLKDSLQSLALHPPRCLVLLDGGLKAPPEYVYQETIIKGDEKEMVIALASIAAKVLRDRRMKQWGQKYPEYGFEIHKGYGTKGHFEAIRRWGMIDLHRHSFII